MKIKHAIGALFLCVLLPLHTALKAWPVVTSKQTLLKLPSAMPAKKKIMEYQISEEAIRRVTYSQYAMNIKEQAAHKNITPFTPIQAARCESLPAYSMHDAAILLNVGSKTLFALLRKHNVLNKQNHPYRQFVTAGYFISVTKTRQQQGLGRVFYATTSVTSKGVVWLHKKLIEWEQ